VHNNIMKMIGFDREKEAIIRVVAPVQSGSKKSAVAPQIRSPPDVHSGSEPP